MPKTIAAQNIASIGSIGFSTDQKGNLTHINASCEVNYGDFGRVETVDILPHLNLAQITAAQAFYSKLGQILTKVLIE